MSTRKGKHVRSQHGSIMERRDRDGQLRYRVRWTDEEGRHSRTFGDIHEAEAFLLTQRKAYASGTYRSPTRRTVGELVGAYLTRLERDHAPSTIATYRQRSRDHLLPQLGQTEISRLDVPTVQRWVDRLSRTLAPSTVRVVGAILSGACAEAVRQGLLERNPTTGVRFPKRRHAETQVWSLPEVRTVLSHTAADGPMWHALYLVALTTGMRRGELLGLLWDSVDLEAGLLTVRRTLSRDAADRVLLRETTKTGRPRTVPLSPQARAALSALPHREGHVFRSPEGHPYLPPTTWQRYHQELCQRAGVPQLRLHDLRHTVATTLIDSGANARTVADILGHSTVAMTMDVYTHAVRSTQDTAVRELGSLLIGDMLPDSTVGDLGDVPLVDPEHIRKGSG